MVSHVIKKSGKRQAFSVAKLKRAVEKAAKDAKLRGSKAKTLAKEVVDPLVKALKRKKTVRASALRKAVLGRIERRAKAVATAWKRFDRKRR